MPGHRTAYHAVLSSLSSPELSVLGIYFLDAAGRYYQKILEQLLLRAVTNDIELTLSPRVICDIFVDVAVWDDGRDTSVPVCRDATCHANKNVNKKQSREKVNMRESVNS